MVRANVNKYLEKVTKPQEIYGMIDSWNLDKHQPGSRPTKATAGAVVPRFPTLWAFGLYLALLCLLEKN